jgi:hypothetical protein
MEPTWTKQIPSSTICNWYYLLFVINVVVFALLIISIVILAVSRGTKGGAFIVQFLTNLVLAVFAGTNSLFYYLMCDRALKPVS